MNNEIRLSVLFVGSYTNCQDYMEGRTVRKGESIAIEKNNTEEDGSHMIVAREVPGALRDARDILRELVDTPVTDVAGHLHNVARAAIWLKEYT